MAGEQWRGTLPPLLCQRTTSNVSQTHSISAQKRPIVRRRGAGNGREEKGEYESLLVRRYIDVRSDIRDTTGLCYAVIAHP